MEKIVYTPKQLRELQLAELEILKDFIRVCDKLKLTYFLATGTLLGCIRHGGFIPWDDDIDVYMVRKDYDVFLAKAQPLLKKRYFLQTYETDPGYTQGFAKIRDSKTTFIESVSKNHRINHGIYIDIFPLDSYDPKRKLHNRINNLIITMQRTKIYRSYSVDSDNPAIRAFTSLPCSAKSIQKSVRKIDRIASKQSEKNQNYDYYKIYAEPTYRDKLYQKDLFDQPITKKFENINVSVPQKYHEYLSYLYGDYMKIPPKSKQIPHHYISKFDLNKSYKTYIENDQ